MSRRRIEEIAQLLKRHGTVQVNDLSRRFGVSEVSVRKYLTTLERQGIAVRFYGGAALADSGPSETAPTPVQVDPLLDTLAREARGHIEDGDSIFVGSGRTCCALARHLAGFKNLTVVTNNISALPELHRNATRVYLIGGEVTTTDHQTLFSSWEAARTQLGGVFVKKAFTSISGLDLKAGLTVDSIISTYVFQQIPSIAHHWYLVADSTKFDRVSIYPVAELSRIHMLITDRLPPEYARRFQDLAVPVVLTGSRA